MKIETAKIELSTHAFERAQERFPEICRSKSSSTNHIKSLLKSSVYIGVVPDKSSVDSHMYVFNKIVAIHVSMDLTQVNTLYEINERHPVFKLRQKVQSIYRKEFSKIHRSEKAQKRKLNYKVLENESQIALLKFRKLKTRSDKVKQECDKLISELQNEIWKLSSDVENTLRDKREVAYAIATDTY